MAKLNQAQQSIEMSLDATNFYDHGLYMSGPNLFNHDKFPKWVTEMTSKYPKDFAEKMLNTLKELYRAKGVADILSSGLEAETESSKIIAKEMVRLYASDWDIDETLKVFRLDNLELDIFKSPDFPNFVAFVKETHRENFETAMLNFLSTKLTKEDLTMFIDRGFEAASDRSREVASELQHLHAQRTMIGMKFKEIGLINNNLNLMGSSTFSELVSFVKLAYEKNPEKAMLDFLSSQFTKEYDLAEVLFRGQKVKDESSKEFSRKLLRLQASQWDINHTFKVLHLAQTDLKLFESPDFPKFVTFVKLNHGENFEKVLLGFLSTKFTKNYLTKVLTHGETVTTESTMAVAEKLRNLHLQRNGINEKFGKLGFEETDLNLMRSSKFPELVDFVKSGYKENFEKAMLDFLSSKFTKEYDLAEVLFRGQEATDESSKEVATKLLRLQASQWDINHTFKVLHHAQTDLKLFESPDFPRFVAFVESAHGENFEKAMLNFLSTKFSENDLTKVIDHGLIATSLTSKKVAHKLQLLQVQRNKINEKFEKLGFKETDLNLMGSSKFPELVDFVKSGYKENFEKAMLDFLSSKFTKEYDLAEVLFRGQEATDESSKEVATKLLRLQASQWDINHTFEVLHLAQTDLKLFESPDFPKFVTFVKLNHGENFEKALLDFLRKKFTEDEDVVYAIGLGESVRDDAVSTLAKNLKFAALVALYMPRKLEIKLGLFQSHVFNEWMYKLTGNIGSDKLALAVMYEGLAKLSTADDLSKVFLAELKDRERAYIALNLLPLQMSAWKSEGNTAVQIYAMLDIQKTELKILEDPIFTAWMRGVTSKAFEDESDQVLSFLVNLFKKDGLVIRCTIR
ncbi:unnamed protein product [Peronospora belbahrii]|uniref:Uncharacterized protein n=1 Tax=Peronospora belbahrii TaxID=622444 RepID=A0AAU9L7E0_9STRA|nr:unnamed protein product [Peronospora belbahrii]